MHVQILNGYLNIVKEVCEKHTDDEDRAFRKDIMIKCMFLAILMLIGIIIPEISSECVKAGIAISILGLIIYMIVIADIAANAPRKCILEDSEKEKYKRMSDLLQNYEIDSLDRNKIYTLIEIFEQKRREANRLVLFLTPAASASAAFAAYHGKLIIPRIVETQELTWAFINEMIFWVLIVGALFFGIAALAFIVSDWNPGKKYDDIIRDLKQMHIFMKWVDASSETADKSNKKDKE